MSALKNFPFILMAAIICIIICGGCLKLANDIYLDTDNDSSYYKYLDDSIYSNYDIRKYSRERGISTEAYILLSEMEVVRDRDLSTSYVILYILAFVFSISLCCFTYICVKSFS